MKRIIFAVCTVLLILTACSPIAPEKTKTGEQRCEDSGGEWRQFPDACADTCSYNRGQADICARL